MDERITGVVMTVLLTTTLLIALFLFSLTGINTEMFTTINIFPVIKIILTPLFISFLITSAIALGITIYIAKKYQFRYAVIFAASGSLLALTVGILLFKLLEFLSVGLIAILAIPIAVKYLQKKEEELKYLKELRAGHSAAGRIIIFLALGFALNTMIFCYANQKELEQNFTNDILNSTIGETETFKDQLNKPVTDAVVAVQQQTVSSLTNSDQFKKLKDKNDVDVINYVATVEAFRSQINSSDYKKTLIEQMEKSGNQINLGEEIISKMPMLENLSKYAWIIYPLVVFTSCFLIGTIIIQNLAAIIYWIIWIVDRTITEKLASHTETTEED